MAKIIFDVALGAVEVNVFKKLDLGKASAVHILKGSTRDVIVNYAGKKEVKIRERGIFRGSLAAPLAKVEFKKGSRLEGAVFGKKIYLDKDVSFNFHENRAPVADSLNVSTSEDTPASITLGGSDPDDDTLTFKLISQPLHGTLAGNAPDLTYSPSENFNGTDQFSFTVNDGTVDAAAALVKITVAAVNDAPVARPQNISLSEDGSLAVVLTAFDVESGTLAYEIVAHPAHGTLAGAAPELIYTPVENYHGSDSFSFRASDGSLDSGIAAVSLTINPVNDAPTAHAGYDRHVFRGDAVNLDGGGSIDVDGNSLTYRWLFTSIPAGSTATLSDPAAASPSFLPDIAGTYIVQLIVNDGIVDSTPDAVNIAANPRMVNVPDLVGLIRADAMSDLTDANLTAGTISDAYSDTIAADHVISQAPDTGASVQEASAVDLVVSLGPERQIPTVSIKTSPVIIDQGQSTTLSWTSTNAVSLHIDNGIGPVNLSDATNVSPEHTTVYTITAIGPDGNSSSKVTIEVHGDPDPQPEGHFGARYEDLVPPDATVDHYDYNRFSLITGLVQDLNDMPLADVSVTIYNHLKYGTASTDSKGRYSIPVEGNATFTVVFQKYGLLTSHRQVYVPVNDIAISETVQMIPQDPVSTTLTFDGNPAKVITHQSTPVIDENGSRSATLVFTGNNRAFLVDENGNDVQELTTITTRATEYSTPKFMPAKLPAVSAYTYCVDFSVDGARSVRFEKPIVTWVDNFLNFPVGEAVPAGYYDRAKGLWMPSDNGIVVKLLDTDADGIVDALDTTGDDEPDDLNWSNSFTDEVAGLDDPERYAPGSTFWRVKIAHFTPWDYNWAWLWPSDSTSPNPKGPPQADQQKTKITDCRRYTNSFIEERSRIFHEDISIPGTDVTLHYASNRTGGYKTLISIPVSGDVVPDSLKRIIVKVEVAGRRFEEVLDPLPNRLAKFEWDGRDHLGRRVVGFTSAHAGIGFVYDVFYARADNSYRAFAQPGFVRTTIRSRQEQILWQRKDIFINQTKGFVAEGWSLSSQHFISPTDLSTLHRGDGMTIRSKSGIVNTIIGKGPTGSLRGGYSGDGGPADEARVWLPIDVTMDAFGNLFIADFLNDRIRKVDTNGIITTVAGNGREGFSGDGGKATEAWLQSPVGVAVDSSGSIYIADMGNHRIRKVDQNGIIKTVAGSGVGGYSGDNGPATEARLLRPQDVAVDGAGNIYIADSDNRCIRKVDPNGIISTVAGTYGAIEDFDYTGDGGPATLAQFFKPVSLALDRNADLFIADMNMHLVRKVDASGIITTVAGKCRNCRDYNGDGIPAIEAHLSYPGGIGLDDMGNLYIGESVNNRIRKVDTNGIITTVAGSGIEGFSGDGGPATEAQFDGSGAVVIDPSGNLIIADSSNNRVRKVAILSTYPASAGVSEATDINFAEENGLGHVMNSSGHHKMTINVNTGVILRQFNYDQSNNLTSITDQFGGQIVIERDSSGIPAAVISPDGIVTQLTIDDNDHLSRITYPDGSFYSFEYSSDGLLTAKIDPENSRFEHVFDSSGRLTAALDDEGGQWIYSSTANANGDILANILTAESNLTTYLDYADSIDTYYSEIVDPTGAKTLFSSSADGLTVNKSLPCGMDLDFEYAFDSEYKYKYVKEITERTPVGLEKVTRRDRIYQDTDGDGIPDRIEDAVTVNNKSATIVNDILQAKKVVNSSEGRTIASSYNPNTLLTESLSIPGIYDISYDYDARGRLTSVSTGARQTSFSYNPSGFLESVTDSENHTTSYRYDLVGRVIGVSRPDGGTLSFNYDNNGNLTLLTNPMEVDHGFGFNNVNRNSSYETPMSGSYSFIYDSERRLIRTDLPSGNSIFIDYTNPDNPEDNSAIRQIRTPEGNIDFAYLCGAKVDSITMDSESIDYGYDGKLVISEALGGTLIQTLECDTMSHS